MERKNIFKNLRSTFLLLMLLILFSWLSASLPIAKTAEKTSQFKTIETEHFKIYAEGSGGRLVARIAEREYNRLTDWYGFGLVRKAKIYVYGDPKKFRAVTPLPSVVGFAIPARNQITILLVSKYKEAIIAHELSHLILLTNIPGGTGLPFWFVEGIANFQSKGIEEGALLEERALSGDILPTESLEQEPADAVTKGKAAAEGYLIVDYIVKNYGNSALKEIVQELRQGTSFKSAIKKILGISEEDLLKNWRRSAEKTRYKIWLASLRYFGFTLLGVTVVAAVVIWLIKRKRQFDLLDQEIEE